MHFVHWVSSFLFVKLIQPVVYYITVNYNIKFWLWQDVDADKSPISVDGALAASSLFKIIVESHLKGTNLFIFSFKCNLRLEECYRCCKRFSILFTSCILITLIFL